MAEKILVVDDEVFLLKLIDKVLGKEGYTVVTAENGEEGISLFQQTAPDLVILDIMMPGINGREVCRRIRQTSSVPIIFLTAMGTEQNVVDGLSSGADDYLTKPIRIKELRARVAALLRRARMPSEQPDVLRFGDKDLIINKTEKTVFVSGEEILLTPIEYNLLLFMAERAGQLLPNKMLSDHVWGPSAEAQPQIRWYVWRLRQKIEQDPQQPCFIFTEWGKGYRFSPK